MISKEAPAAGSKEGNTDSAEKRFGYLYSRMRYKAADFGGVKWEYLDMDTSGGKTAVLHKWECSCK